MVLETLTGNISNLFALAFGGFESQMMSLILYTLGMVVYGIVIWNYYRHLAKRDIFKVDFSKYRKEGIKFAGLRRFFDGLFYIIKYIIMFPFFTFLWFAILSFFLFFLAKGQAVDNILLISITIVSAVRVTAYYNEDLSKDIAKMIPFTLLGVFVVDPTFLSLPMVWGRFVSIPSFLELIKRYLLFVIILEFGLRLLSGFFGVFKRVVGIGKPKMEAPPKPKEQKLI